MNKIIRYTVTAFFICILLCACSKTSGVPDLNISVEAEITHNESNGINQHENPNKQPTLDPDFGSEMIDKEDMQNVIEKTENGIHGIDQEEVYSKANAAEAYNQAHTIYNEVQATAKSNLEQMLIDANERMWSILEGKKLRSDIE